MRNLTYNEKRLKHQKEVKSKKRTVFMVGIIVTIVGFIYFLAFSGVTAVQGFEINVSNDQIRELVNTKITSILNQSKWKIFKKSSHIFLVDSDKLAQDIKDGLPEIENVLILKNYFKRSLGIVIKVKEQFGLYCRGTARCFYFDQDGFLFKEAPFISGGKLAVIVEEDGPDLKIGDTIRTLESDELKSVLKAYRLLYESNFITFDYILISRYEPKEYRIKTTSGYSIQMSTLINPEPQLLGLRKLFKDDSTLANRQFEYIDLRVENRIYYK